MVDDPDGNAAMNRIIRSVSGHAATVPTSASPGENDVMNAIIRRAAGRSTTTYIDTDDQPPPVSGTEETP